MDNHSNVGAAAYYRLAMIATLLALIVVMLGAYTRLGDAGLGCPDWPGCYGHLTVPQTEPAMQQAQKAFQQTVVPAKAWKEMVHRYFAGTLALLIGILGVWGLIRRKKHPCQPVVAPVLLLLLIIFQALLGMWTVTWKVLPLIVTAHLLGGMTTAALLWYLALASHPQRLSSSAVMLKTFSPAKTAHLPVTAARKGFKFWAILGLCIVVCQVFLGAWTSTNYAAIVCPSFPYCQGSLFPTLDFQHAFNFFQPIGANYEGGVLSITTRMTIQMMHRYGAFVTATYLLIFAFCLIFSKEQAKLWVLGWVLFAVLLLQFTLGVLNVLLMLPMPVAVAHNGGAALLLLVLVTIVYKVFDKPMLRQ